MTSSTRASSFDWWWCRGAEHFTTDNLIYYCIITVIFLFLTCYQSLLYYSRAVTTLLNLYFQWPTFTRFPNSLISVESRQQGPSKTHTFLPTQLSFCFLITHFSLVFIFYIIFEMVFHSFYYTPFHFCFTLGLFALVNSLVIFCFICIFESVIRLLVLFSLNHVCFIHIFPTFKTFSFGFTLLSLWRRQDSFSVDILASLIIFCLCRRSLLWLFCVQSFDWSLVRLTVSFNQHLFVIYTILYLQMIQCLQSTIFST